MFWWFERNGRFMRCETRHVRGDDYELVITGSDGSDRVERFANSADLTRRQEDLERDLLADGWTGPHGWNV